MDVLMEMIGFDPLLIHNVIPLGQLIASPPFSLFKSNVFHLELSIFIPYF